MIVLGQYYSNQVASIPSGSTAGSASFLATNPAATGSPSVNITLVVTDTTDADNASTAVSNVIYQIFEPNASGVTILHSATLPQF
jgi:hypothetical protein